MIGPALPDFRFAAGDPPPRSDHRHGSKVTIGVDLATHVLVIEDEAMIGWMLESLLESMGFTSIALAATGEEALEAARDIAPGLIVTDVNLGRGMDGIAASSAIQAQSGAAVILITGYGLDEARSRSAGTIPGAPILRKPVQVLDLRNAVAGVLGGGENPQ